jgi:16S rRNA C967 or C1407 C5-methylase (RsmB/RsmF family)
MKKISNFEEFLKEVRNYGSLDDDAWRFTGQDAAKASGRNYPDYGSAEGDPYEFGDIEWKKTDKKEKREKFYPLFDEIKKGEILSCYSASQYNEIKMNIAKFDKYAIRYVLNKRDESERIEILNNIGLIEAEIYKQTYKFDEIKKEFFIILKNSDESIWCKYKSDSYNKYIELYDISK